MENTFFLSTESLHLNAEVEASTAAVSDAKFAKKTAYSMYRLYIICIYVHISIYMLICIYKI